MASPCLYNLMSHKYAAMIDMDCRTDGQIASNHGSSVAVPDSVIASLCNWNQSAFHVM